MSHQPNFVPYALAPFLCPRSIGLICILDAMALVLCPRCTSPVSALEANANISFNFKNFGSSTLLFKASKYGFEMFGFCCAWLLAKKFLSGWWSYKCLVKLSFQQFFLASPASPGCLPNQTFVELGFYIFVIFILKVIICKKLKA